MRGEAAAVTRSGGEGAAEHLGVHARGLVAVVAVGDQEVSVLERREAEGRVVVEHGDLRGPSGVLADPVQRDAHLVRVGGRDHEVVGGLVRVGENLGRATSGEDYNSLAVPALVSGTTYYWRVVSRTYVTDSQPQIVRASEIWSFTTAGSTTPPPTGGSGPYTGTAVALPGTIQVENFDTGAAGVAYVIGKICLGLRTDYLAIATIGGSA